MSFYNVQNSRNFLVRDPLAKLTNDVQELNAEMDQIKNNKPGKTLFFNYPSPNPYQAYEFANASSSVQSFLSQNCYASYSIQDMGISSRTDILAPNETRYVSFITDPRKDAFSNFINSGLWQTHLFCNSSSSDIYVSVFHVTLFEQNGAVYTTTFQSNQDTKLIEQSSGPVEYIFNAHVDGIDIPHPQTEQYLTVIMMYNTNQLYSTSLTTYYGTDNYQVQGSRVETTLTEVSPPKHVFSWKCGAWSEYPTNPIEGQFCIMDQDTEEPVYSPFNMYDLYNNDYYLRLHSTSFGGANLYNWFRDSNYNFIQITNDRDPSNFIIGTVNSYGLDNGTYNSSTTYRNFNYIVKRTYGDDPSVNRMFIFSLTGNNGSADVNSFYVYSATDTNDDDLEIDFNGVNPDVQVYTVVYGAIEDPLSPQELNAYFRSFVDHVLIENDQVANIETMQYQFNTHFGDLISSLPPLYPNFEFLNYSNLAGTTSGIGSDFQAELAIGRQYIVPSDPVNNSGFNYQVGDTVTILGQFLGGEDGVNDAVLTITEIDGSGGVVAFTVEGTPKYLQSQEYISDGGDDQYDSGNYLHSASSTVNYGTGAIQYNVFEADSEMFIDYNDSIFVCVITNAYNNSYFSTSGNMGADGKGSVDLLNSNFPFYIELNEDNALGANGKIVPGEVYHFNLSVENGAFGNARSKEEKTTTRKVKREQYLATLTDKQRARKARKQQRKYKANRSSSTSSITDWSASRSISTIVDDFKHEVQLLKNRRQ